MSSSCRSLDDIGQILDLFPEKKHWVLVALGGLYAFYVANF